MKFNDGDVARVKNTGEIVVILKSKITDWRDLKGLSYLVLYPDRSIKWIWGLALETVSTEDRREIQKKAVNEYKAYKQRRGYKKEEGEK